jgi:hypothetical protein
LESSIGVNGTICFVEKKEEERGGRKIEFQGG